MTILASRAHTCVHPQVSKAPGKDDACKKLTNPKKTGGGPAYENGSCIYHQNFKKKPLSYENYGFKEAWDIEDLVKSFRRKRICPYYAAREIKDTVDIVFCPYNYLIDPKIRKSMKINLDEQIVIVDEAHNVEDSCRESTNSLITKHHLESSIKDLTELMASNSVPLPNEMRQAAEFFRDLFGKLSGWIDMNTTNLDQRDFDASMSRIFTGTEMVCELKTKIGLGPEMIGEYQEHLSNLFMEPDKEDENPIIIPDGIKTITEHLYMAVDFLYMNNHDYMDDFKVAIIRTKLEDLPQATGEEDSSTQQPRMSQYYNKVSKWTFSKFILISISLFFIFL